MVAAPAQDGSVWREPRPEQNFFGIQIVAIEITYPPTSRYLNSTAVKLALILFSVISFLGYGSACFLLTSFKTEFERYGLAAQRPLVGALQLGAALGLVAGLDQPWIGLAASGGLALMMLVAVGVRIKIKDPLPRTTPAVLYLALNAYLCLFAF